jgi:hypothetical protein
MSRYVSFFLEDIPAEYLDAMVATQLWGEDEKQVLNCLVLEGMRGAISGKLIPLREADEEVTEAPPQERAPGHVYKCDVCKDGTAEAGARAEVCGACGEDWAIPF